MGPIEQGEGEIGSGLRHVKICSTGAVLYGKLMLSRGTHRVFFIFLIDIEIKKQSQQQKCEQG